MLKKMLFAVMMMAASVQAFAQYGRTVETTYQNHSIYYGLRMGLALANVNSDDPILDGGSMQAGLNLGAVIGFQLSDQVPVYLESGLFYTEKGGKGNNPEGGSKFTYSLNYFEMPVLIKYRYELDDDLSIQPFAGGYLAIGVGGKMKDYGAREVKSSFSDNFFKRFDGGLKIGFGMEYQLIYGELAYDFGLANICHSEFESSHTGCLYLNLGVNF